MAKATNKPAAATETKVPKKKAVTGFSPLRFKGFTITQKRSGKYAVVTTATGKQVNAAEKEKLLIEAKLNKGSFKKVAAEETSAT